MKRLSVARLDWLLFIAPALLIVVVFFIIPVIGGFIYSFTDWSGLSNRINFIGLANFHQLLRDDKFYLGLGHTLAFAFSITVFQNLCGLLVALALDRQFRGRNFFRTVFYLPAVLSPLVVGYAWSFIFNPNMGALNIFLKGTGLKFLALDWLGNPKLALFSVAFVVIWQYIGYSMVIYIAGLQGISPELYEAGDIDGVNKWQRFKYITFPLLAPAVSINVLLTLISTLKAFDHIFVMTKGGPGYASEVISTLLYREAFTNNNMGYGSAISVVLFGMITAVSFTVLKYLRSREVNT